MVKRHESLFGTVLVCIRLCNSNAYGKAHELGLTPIYWDNGAFSGSGENFGLINHRTGQPNSDEAKTVVETW